MTAMDRFERVGRYTVVLAAALVVAASAGSAQERGTGEGIKVHGHWTIDVKNPDGTLAAHHEFKNALQYAGQIALSGLLAGQLSQGGWAIYSIDPGGTLTRLTEDQGAVSHLPSYITALSNNLTVNVSTTPTQSQTVLQGSAATPSLLQIATVGTYLVSGSQNGVFYTFTEHTLAQPITVQAGQIVQVTVVFSFS